MSQASAGKSAPKPRKLKVYEAQIGFYDTVVAAANMTAALRAWGTHRNLFTDGEAKETTDAKAIEAALAQPETPLRRGVGTGDPFSLHPKLPSLPDLPEHADEPREPKKPQPARPAVKAPPKPPPPPPPPSRSALSAAEAAVAALAKARRQEEDEFRTRRDELDAEEAAARRHHQADEAEAASALRKAEKAYVAAGGQLGRAR